MYSKYVTLNVNVTDQLGRVVDGAEVLVAAQHSDSEPLVVAYLGFTDMDGTVSIDLKNGRDYWALVKSPAGLWPGPEDNKVTQVLTKSLSNIPGEILEVDVQLEGELPAPPWDFEVKGESVPEGLALRIASSTYVHALEANNRVFERRFDEFYDGGKLEAFVLDEANFWLLQTGQPFEVLAHWPEAETLDEAVDVEAPAEGEALYVVASNRARYGHSHFLDIGVTHEGGPPPDPPPTETPPAVLAAGGGCLCGVPGGDRRGTGSAALILLCAGLGLRRRWAKSGGRTSSQQPTL